MPSEPLIQLSADEMRSYGYRIVDILVDHIGALPDKFPTRTTDRATLEKRLGGPPPRKGVGAGAALDLFEQEVLSSMMHPDHPRYFAFVPGPGNYVSAMADALASGFNIFAGTWLEGSAAAQVELVTLDWLIQTCGLPASTGGSFVSGGSMANLTALAIARQVKLSGDMTNAVVYASDQTHSCIARGMRVLGFRPDQLRVVPTNSDFQLDMGELIQVIEADRLSGLIPFCIVATAGTTNTGAIDPLDEIADLCEAENIWFHIDGAYGAPAALTKRGKILMKGIERADTLVLDPHKWLFQPYEMGCLLARESSWFGETFRIVPEYLEDAETKVDEVNFWERGVQLTRRFRALKFWLSVQVFGWDAFVSAVEVGFQSAEYVERYVQGLAGWCVVTPAQLGIVTFRYEHPEMDQGQMNKLNRALVQDIITDGTAMVTSTVLRERTVLRLCTINPRTSSEDLKMTLDRLNDFAIKRASEMMDGK
jgi:glutamate/tyrosine decarboxylase-like PLP-dependent enzyme